MSTQTQGAHTVSGRNPRRRGRKDVEDAASIRSQPVRKRPKTSANGASVAPVDSEMTNGHAVAPLTHDIPVRQAPKAADDPSLDILVKNENYTVGQLPGLPKELRTSREDYRGHFDPSSKLALALTKSTAYVWNYSSSSPSPPTKSVRLTTPTRPDEPLPFGSLVITGSQTSIGLLTIHPRSGKVTYWENLDSADALNFFAHRRTSSEGSVGLYSGETVVNIENAHVAGFVVTTSSDRLAQLQLRDAQSRPSINIQYLRAQKSSASGGLFGGILSAFAGAGLVRDVAAVRVQQISTRGPVHLFVASQHGQFQQWQLNWSEAPFLIAEWDGREQMQAAAREELERYSPSMVQSSKLLDIALMTEDANASTASEDGAIASIRLLGLYSIIGASFRTYAIGSLALSEDGSCTFGKMINLKSYSPPLSSASRWRPKLCVPSAALTAFVFFDKAIATISLAGIFDNGTVKEQSDVYQDTVYLKDDDQVHLTGASVEVLNQARKQSTALALVKGTGAITITIKEPSGPTQAVSRSKVSIRSKIEQAVLYGSKPSNPLDLARMPELPFERAEVEEAVIATSEAILKSAYPTLTRNIASTDQQLSRRQHVLEGLARHVKDNYPGLSRRTRWQLLWDAEKLAAARVVNRVYNEQATETLNNPDIPSERKMLLPELVESLPEDRRSIRPLEWDDVGHLGHFLVFDTDKFTDVLSWTYNGVYQLAQQSDVRDSIEILFLVRDATQTAFHAIETALRFRVDNLWSYDLQEEPLEDGFLNSPASYEDIPTPWTSSPPIASKIFELAGNAQSLMEDDFEEARAKDGVLSDVATDIASENPRLISAWCRVAQEHIFWSAAQPAQSMYHQDLRQAQQDFDEKLTGLLPLLAQVDRTTEGMAIAEKYHQMSALTKLVREESGSLFNIAQMYAQAKPHETLQEELIRRKSKEQAEERISALEQRIAEYCKTYGYDFTNPYYSALVSKHSYGSLLQQSGAYKQEVADFLHAEPARRPLAWINDVISEKDYSTAGEALSTEATSAERKAWNRGVELAFAKLALLAADEDDAVPSASASAPGHLEEDLPEHGSHWRQNATRHEQASTLLRVQAQLWDRLRPITYNALDEESKVQLLMEALGKGLEKHKRRRLHALLSTGIESLIADDALNAETLVDILTLIDNQSENKDSADIGKDMFFLALLAVQNDASLTEDRKETLVKTCCRRAMLADRWSDISKQTAKNRMSDDAVRQLLSSTTFCKTLSAGFRATLERDGEEPLTNGAVNGEPAPLAYLSDISTPEPSQCLTAGTTVDDWVTRFGEDRREIAEPLADECRVEEKWLREAIDKHQLERWWGACRSIALEDARGGAQRL